MDSKTRFLMALAHEKPDCVPFNFWMDRRLMDQYEKQIGHRNWRVTHYGADVIEAFASLEFPTGKMVEHTGTNWLQEPLFEDWSSADSIKLPDACDEAVYDDIKRELKEHPDTAILLDMPTAWGLIAGLMVGYERAYMDIYQYEDEFKKLSRRITDVQKQAVEKACQLGVTALYLMEDVSTTQGLSMSPGMIREYVFDYAREMKDIADSYDIPTLFHCCGKITDELADMFVELGVNAINPLQPSVNDTADFAAKYQDKLAVYGGLDNCFTIPQGTPAAIEEHVFRQFELLGKPSGGLIFSSHDIDVSAPKENIETMVSAIKHCVY
ncbi:MAG: hypothetical protein JW936_09135 [Sedimentisphaerales bacterium]|nr:hypothetical protein [Sedimentisphaerales bacterium]